MEVSVYPLPGEPGPGSVCPNLSRRGPGSSPQTPPTKTRHFHRGRGGTVKRAPEGVRSYSRRRGNRRAPRRSVLYVGPPQSCRDGRRRACRGAGPDLWTSRRRPPRARSVRKAPRPTPHDTTGRVDDAGCSHTSTPRSSRTPVLHHFDGESTPGTPRRSATTPPGSSVPKRTPVGSRKDIPPQTRCVDTASRSRTVPEVTGVLCVPPPDRTRVTGKEEDP